MPRPRLHQPAPGMLTADEKKWLLELARNALIQAATRGPLPEPKTPFPRLAELRACFVTLTKSGALRGCLGHVLPRAPLYLAAADITRWAALRDPRFPPVHPEELDAIQIEISVLTQPVAVDFGSPEELLNQLRPHEHGVVLQIGTRIATFLPKVWAQLPGKEDFLNHLSEKSGCDPSAWRTEKALFWVFHAESFDESSFHNSPPTQ